MKSALPVTGFTVSTRSMNYYHGLQTFSVKGQAVLFSALWAKLAISVKHKSDQTNEHAMLQ